MRFISRFVTLAFSLIVALEAFGGSGQGGGGVGAFTKTALLLQSHSYDQAFLSFEGGTALPEGEFTPQLVIPEDEYGAFVEKYEEGKKNSTPFVLPVDGADGKVHNYELRNAGEGEGTLFLFLFEI